MRYLVAKNSRTCGWLYSTGGACPQYVENIDRAKLWTGMGPVKNHLNQLSVAEQKTLTVFPVTVLFGADSQAIPARSLTEEAQKAREGRAEAAKKADKIRRIEELKKELDKLKSEG
jgi:hypothetical protein